MRRKPSGYRRLYGLSLLEDARKAWPVWLCLLVLPLSLFFRTAAFGPERSLRARVISMGVAHGGDGGHVFLVARTERGDVVRVSDHTRTARVGDEVELTAKDRLLWSDAHSFVKIIDE